MTDDDPVPLKAGGEATPELVRALSELGKPGPDAARLARVAQRLGAALADAPPPEASSGLSKLFGTKTLITGIVIGLAALSWLGYTVAGHREQPVQPAKPSAVDTSRLDVANTPDVLAASREPDARPNAPVVAPPSDASRAAAPASRRPVRHAASTSNASRTPEAPSEAPASVASGSAQPVAAIVDTASAAAEEKTKPRTTVQPAVAQPENAAPRSEVELLFDARKSMPAQPTAALRLLDEHAARFPDGMLGPEREVLRIEALRKLGRTAEAAQRLRQFESRYPKSIHLRRLQGEPSAKR